MSTTYPQWFEEFWEPTCKAGAKYSCFKACAKAIKGYTEDGLHVQASIDEIAAGYHNYEAAEQMRRDASPGDYRPLHISTWVNRCGWEDEVVFEPRSSLPSYQQGAADHFNKQQS